MLETKKIFKIDLYSQWYLPFYICVLYISKFTDQAKSMIKYIEIIRSIDKNGYDFISFDRGWLFTPI